MLTRHKAHNPDSPAILCNYRTTLPIPEFSAFSPKNEVRYFIYNPERDHYSAQFVTERWGIKR